MHPRESPRVGSVSVSPSPSLHLNLAREHSRPVVTLQWLLKLSSLSAGKALELCRVLPGHQSPHWTKDASTRHSRTSACPCMATPLSMPGRLSPLGPHLHLPPQHSLPLLSDFLPPSLIQVHMRQAVTLLLPWPPLSSLPHLSVFVVTWNFLAWHGLGA